MDSWRIWRCDGVEVEVEVERYRLCVKVQDDEIVVVSGYSSCRCEIIFVESVALVKMAVIEEGMVWTAGGVPVGWYLSS